MDKKIIKLSDYHKPHRLKKYAGTAHGVCFTGMSGSFQDDESDIIIIASSLEDLERHWLRAFGRKPEVDCKVQQAAAFHFRHMKGNLLFE